MTNPTSNYNFQMPTATDLVTDLPADFEVFGQAVDTRLKALQPGTTLGDLAYSSATANTNTRLPIGTSGQVLAVSGGGVPAWTTTADVTPLTTKGDLFTFTTADARLGVGANGTILTADSSESTGLKWSTPSSGLTLITRQSFSGVATTSTTFDGCFTSTYKNYQIVIEDMESTTNNTFLYFQYRYAGPTTQAAAYYGSVTNYDHNGTTTNTPMAGVNQISMMKIGYSSVGTNGQVGNYYVSKVGASGKPAITGQGAGNATTGAFNLGCTMDTQRVYTGFILSAAAGNITGTVAVYGLATA